jgi:uncharacterized protein (TIGR02145 family)
MKKFILLLIYLVLVNYTYSQSLFSVLGKAGGQLIQDLSKKDEWRSIGKAIETAADITYEIEKINARNNEEITIKINPDNIQRVYPKEGYKWENPDDPNDYSIEKIEYIDIEKRDNAFELFEKGGRYLEKGDWDNALTYLSQSIEIKKTPGAYLIRAVLYNYNGMYEKALEDIGTIFNFDVYPEYFILFFNFKGSILNNMGESKEAITLFNKAINLQKESSSSYDFSCEILKNRGHAKENIGDHQNAISDYNKSIEICPNNSMVYVQRGISKIKLNDYKSASSDINIALSILTDEEIVSKFVCFEMKAIINFGLNNYKETIQYANEAIEMYNNNNMTLSDMYYPCYYFRGKAKIELGINKSGCSDIMKAKELGMDIENKYYNEHCIRVRVMEGNFFTDSRDGQTYKTVKIGNQVWMAENLNYKTSNSWCYNNNSSFCDLLFGRLYTWESAKKSCPVGWHLPTDEEWAELTNYLGGKSVAGGKLKETDTTHWSSPNTGATNESGFTALPGGDWMPSDDSFKGVPQIANFWSDTEYSSQYSWMRILIYNNEKVIRGYYDKPAGLSVRCLKD